ncbi:MAG: hypothetical protein KDB38_08725, partial [Nocardioidaceae bacterium]|nr:hypothetical protein [Nocardioidaceae bacterium]
VNDFTIDIRFQLPSGPVWVNGRADSELVGDSDFDSLSALDPHPLIAMAARVPNVMAIILVMVFMMPPQRPRA